jgi:hypothetical protein
VISSVYVLLLSQDKTKTVTHNVKQSTVHPITGHEGTEGEYRYSSTLSLTSALDGVGGQRNAPPALPPGTTLYPLYRRLGGAHGRSFFFFFLY